MGSSTKFVCPDAFKQSDLSKLFFFVHGSKLRLVPKENNILAHNIYIIYIIYSSLQQYAIDVLRDFSFLLDPGGVSALF